MTLRERIASAMWAGDVDALDELAPCRCCCAEHTFSDCEAREWHGCRSGLKLGETDPWDERGWLAHYMLFHGMTEQAFYGYSPDWTEYNDSDP